MYNFTSTTYSSASQNSTEIAKMIRQGFLGAETPTYEGQKIAKRTNANASVIRDVDDWKVTYYRRAGHKSQGFFSALAQPYEELGETELNTKSLVVNAMKDIGGIFEPEKKLLFRPQKMKPDNLQEKNDSKIPKVKHTEKQNDHESIDSGFETVRELLNDAEVKIAYLKAGKPLIDCLGDTSKIAIERRQSNGNQKRGKLIMETPNHLIQKDSISESGSRSRGEPDSKARKHFLAKLRCLKTIFCCVLNMKNRDLRNKNPLMRETLQFLKREVGIDLLQPQPASIRMPRLSAVPAVILPNHRSLKLQNVSSCETGSLGPPSLVLGRAPTVVPSTDDCESSTSRYRLSTADTGIKTGQPLTRTGIKISPSKLAALNHGVRSEGLDSVLSPQAEQMKMNESLPTDQLSLGKGGKFSSFLASFRTALKPRRGAIYQNKGNYDLPLWQRVIQEEARREETKHSRKAKELKNKQPEDVENILKQTKKAFVSMKSRHAKKLQKELHTRVGYLRQRFNCLEVSIFHEEDLKNMRLKVRELQRRESLDNACPTGWYELLCNEQSSLKLDNDNEVSSEVKSLLQFTRMEVTTIVHLRAKLCLLVMSLPVYELCRLSMQEALKFFLSSIMEVSEHALEDWMLSRKLITSNVLME
ncbi:uncharacterized protein LOC135690330 [Rhopilema esculentum]|uniref:uncharacterized protein LOC135690330 n=1 Tax=Rhopilema esculentum TaxID=499914 RepID=UPI0031D167F7